MARIHGARTPSIPANPRLAGDGEQPPGPYERADQTERNAAIVVAYVGGTPSADLARRFGVSRERVRQVLLKSGCVLPGERKCSVEGCAIAPRYPRLACASHSKTSKEPRVLVRNQHGTFESYQRRGCHCALCRDAARARADDQRQKRWRMRETNPERVPHGYSGYINWGCRCDVCFEAMFGRPRTRAFAPRPNRAGHPLLAARKPPEEPAA